MTAERLQSYLFKTEAQWNACLFVQADRSSLPGKGGLRPFPPFARPATLYPTTGARAPAITPTGEVLWFDPSGSMHRLPADDEAPRLVPAPFATSDLTRVVATSRGLWAIGDPPGSLQVYEPDTLARLFTVDLQNARPLDIASDGHDGLWALLETQGKWQAARVDCGGRIGEPVTLEGLAQPVAFVFLPRSQRFVVLTTEPHPRLRWFSSDGRALFSLQVGAMRPCFVAHVLGSDTRDRVFVAGADGEEFGGDTYVVIYDADGNRLGDVPLDESGPTRATGLAGSRDSLVVTVERGALRFRAADVVPDGAGEVRCMLITPMLYSPDREDPRRWLRMDASTTLPEGSTLELSFAATDDTETRNRLTGIAADESQPASHRVRKLLGEPDIWRAPTMFHGSGSQPEKSPAVFSAPLFDVRERYLWACVTLIAAPGAKLPAVAELAVRYPGRSLIDELPAMYRRGEGEPGNFVRALVGVLEATTQGLDDRIASLGSHVHPDTASAPWLDFVARWLGVPWDDGLSVDQKKAMVQRAGDLASRRGTRAGLETLLESLMPGIPRRFRVSDTTADFGFAIVGDGACEGSALPAMLGGRAPWSAELDAGAVLGAMRLPCPGQFDDGTWRLTGRIRVDVAATAQERKAWEPWLLALISEMVPLTARVELRWVSSHALRGNRLDGNLTLEAAPLAHLGTDAVTGLARLPERGNRLSARGPDIGTRLG
jgi:phage tail-like protein